MGPTEGLILLFIVLVLFGPTLVAFFLGYSLGKKKATTAEVDSTQDTTPTSEGSASGEERDA